MSDEPLDTGPIDGPLTLNEGDFTECVMGAGVLLRQFEHHNGRPMAVGEAIGEMGELLNRLIEVRHISIAEAKNVLLLAAVLGLQAERPPRE